MSESDTILGADPDDQHPPLEVYLDCPEAAAPVNGTALPTGHDTLELTPAEYARRVTQKRWDFEIDWLLETEPHSTSFQIRDLAISLGISPAAVAAEVKQRQSASDQGWPGALDIKALAALEPEQPRFIISDWLPTGYATLLAGHGGVGKSAIALHLAVCCATGEPFFGLAVARRRVLYLSCEDRKAILHWRLSRICSWMGLDLASLKGWLEIIDLVGTDSFLWERDPRTGNTATPAYAHLKQRMASYQTEILMIDGVTDTFAGNESWRAEVKRFVNSLVALIPPDDGAVLLVGHVSKPGVVNGEGYSGTTGWHNSVRARWYLYPEMIQSDSGERPARSGALLLELQKSNHGRTDQAVRFRWDATARLFLGEAVGESVFDRKLLASEEQSGILQALQGCAKANIVIPASLQGPRTTFHVLSIRPEFPKTITENGTSKKRFYRHIEELRQLGAIEEIEYRRSNRHFGARLVITAKGLSLCANI